MALLSWNQTKSGQIKALVWGLWESVSGNEICPQEMLKA